MAVFHRFCFWFSLRLGGIIIAIIILVEAIGFLVMFGQCFGRQKETSDILEKFLKDLDVFTNSFVRSVVSGIYYILLLLLIFYGILSASCILLIIGALYLMPKLIYPFYFIYGIYIIKLIILLFYISRYFVKKSDHDLGLNIVYLSAGFFILIFHGYKWLCVGSLVSVIGNLQREVAKMMKRKIVLTRFEMSVQENRKKKNTNKNAMWQGGTPVLPVVDDKNFSPKKCVVAFHK